ncbi:hypothetical protein BH11PSE11_BH11PSE11_27930 [soil metagenome]
MDRSSILVAVTFLVTLVLPFSSFAQQEPVPGKWQKIFFAFTFNDQSKTFVPFSLQSSDNDIATECLSKEYFREKFSPAQKFRSEDHSQQGRRCVVSDEEQSGSTKTWRQVCTDTDGSTEDARWVILNSSSEGALERDVVSTYRRVSSADLVLRSKQVITLKRIGECDDAAKSLALPNTQPTQSEQEASDRRYETRDGDVVRDKKTGLDWTQSDNGSNINWVDARRYCAAKGNGWRLGSTDELESLYDKLQSAPCGTHTCRVSSKFRLTDSWFWSNESERTSFPWTVYLHVGGKFAHHEKLDSYTRVLCVRTL